MRAYALLPLLLTLACGGSGAYDPQSVLRSYARALEEGRAEDAYRWLSDDARRGISLDAFRKMVRESPDDARELGRALSRPTSPAVVTASVVSPDGQELRLVLEKGAWKLDFSAIQIYGQDTPRNTVRGFVRALEHKRYDILMRYVPEAQKEGLSAAKLKVAWEGPDKDEMTQILSGLKPVLATAPIEETGDRATLQYGTATMLLVREHGVWKIEEFD